MDDRRGHALLLPVQAAGLGASQAAVGQRFVLDARGLNVDVVRSKIGTVQQRAIAALEEERDALVLRLETDLTRQEIQTLQDFVAQIADGWEAAEDTFETRRHVIDIIDFQATLLLDEDGVRRVHAHCRLGSGTFRIAPKNTHGHNAQIPFAMTTRLVITRRTRTQDRLDAAGSAEPL